MARKAPVCPRKAADQELKAHLAKALGNQGE
jgi:hypothetical protein